MQKECWDFRALCLIGYVVVFMTANGVSALRDLKIKVPRAVIRGKDALLQCTFDLEDEKLYSVKWYRGGWEFYRYTPREMPTFRQFNIRGLNVKESESKVGKVVLENVQREISGPFSCEVTADQPSFFTEMQTAEMQVVDPPRKDPYITGLKSRYKLDEILKANCTSEHSSPAANITWYINGFPVHGPQVKRHIVASYPENYRTVYSTIRLRITRDQFDGDRMKLRCSASMYDVYHKSSEVSAALWESGHHRTKSYDASVPSSTRQPVSSQIDHVLSAEKPTEITTKLSFQYPNNSSTRRELVNSYIFIISMFIASMRS